jgi:hypothetical protein
MPEISRIQALIKLYQRQPELFTSEQADELGNMAESAGLKWKPKPQDFHLMKALSLASSGFIEGFTTFAIGKDKPSNTYESIAYSLGHLAGFAPGIMAAPFKGIAKGASKVGLLPITKVAETAAKGAQTIHKYSIPMMFGDMASTGVGKIMSKTGLEAANFLKRGSVTRDIVQSATHLGAASAISSVWHGPDEILNSLVHGAVAGGAFGGIGNFVNLGRLMKSKNPDQIAKAEALLRTGIGSTMLGLPTTLQGEPIEMQLYQYLLGGFFGFQSMPSHIKESQRFFQEDLYSGEFGSQFYPESNKVWSSMSKKTQDYITYEMDTQARSFLKNLEVLPNIDQSLRELAKERFSTNTPSERQVGKMARELAYNIYTGAEDIMIVKPEGASYNDEREDFDQPININAPDKAENPVEIIEIYEDGTANVVRARGEYHGNRVGLGYEGQRPTEQLEGQEYGNLQYVTIIDSKSKFRKLSNPLSHKLVFDSKGNPKLVPTLSPEQWHAVEHHLYNKNKYIYGGVKDKGTLRIRPLHIDTFKYSKAQIIRSLATILSPDGKQKLEPARYAELNRSFAESEAKEIEWLGTDNKKVREMHEKMWISNVLSENEREGFYITGSDDLSLIGYSYEKGTIKNVTDWNKREQLLFDTGIPLNPDVIPGGILSYAILNDHKYEMRTIKGGDKEPLESDTDGSIYIRRKVFDEIIKAHDLQNTSMLKPVIVSRNEGGVILVKSAARRATKKMDNFMREEGLDMVFMRSSVKAKGVTLKSSNYEFVDNKYRAYDIDMRVMPTEDVRINTTTKEDFKSVNPTKIVRQLFGQISDNPILSKYIYNNIYKPIIEGNPEVNARIDNYISTGDPSKLGGDIKINDIHPKTIHKILVDLPSTDLARHIRSQIMNLDKTGQLEGIYDFTPEEWKQYVYRNNRILQASNFDEAFTNLYKSTRKNFESAYRKYIISRYLQPVYPYSAKGWLAPKDLERIVTDDVKAGEFMLDNGHKKMRVRLNNETAARDNIKVETDGSSSLGDVWKGYEKAIKDKKNVSQYLEAFDFMTIRVPADSISGVRVLRFKGFTGERGVSIVTNAKDNDYLGGADKDSDSAFLYQGVDKKVRDYFVKHADEWENNGIWTPPKDPELDAIFGKGDTAPYERVASKFSPSMRKIVARSAAKGNDGLGFGVRAKNTTQAWFETIKNNGGEMNFDIVIKGKGENYYNAVLQIRTKGDGTALKILGREMINRSADAANYPEMVDFTEFRKILFDSSFDATIIYKNGRRKPATFEDINKYTPLSDAHKLQNVINPSGKTDRSKSPRAFTLDEFQQEVENLSNTSVDNIYGLAAKAMHADGVHKSISIKNLEAYYDIILEANDIFKATNPKTRKEQLFVRNHLAQIIKKVVVGSNKTVNDMIEAGKSWETIRDFVANDTALIASYNTLAKKGFDIYRRLVKNGVVNPEDAVKDLLKPIAKEATRLKAKYENIDDSEEPTRGFFTDYDKEVAAYKSEVLNLNSLSNQLPIQYLHDYFDLWLISPFKYGDYKTRKGGISRIPQQSSSVSDRSWKIFTDEYSRLYRQIRETTKLPESIEKIARKIEGGGYGMKLEIKDITEILSASGKAHLFPDLETLHNNSARLDGFDVSRDKAVVLFLENIKRQAHKQRGVDFRNRKAIDELIDEAIIYVTHPSKRSYPKAQQLAEEALTKLHEDLSNYIKSEGIENIIALSKSKTSAAPTKPRISATKGVNVMRGSKWGNPFIVPDVYDKSPAYYKKQGFIKAKSREDAIQSYEDWIKGTAHKDFLPERRAAIIAGLKSGELQGKTLKYYKPDATDSHAVRLAKLVAEQEAAAPIEVPKKPVAEGIVFTPPGKAKIQEDLNKSRSFKEILKVIKASPTIKSEDIDFVINEMSNDPFWKEYPEDAFIEMTKLYEGIGRDFSTLTEHDILVIKNHFIHMNEVTSQSFKDKILKKVFGKDVDTKKIQRIIYWNRPITIDKRTAQWESRAFEQATQPVRSSDKVYMRDVKRPMSTYGVLREFLTKMVHQSEVSVGELNQKLQEVYRRREELTNTEAHKLWDFVIRLREGDIEGINPKELKAFKEKEFTLHEYEIDPKTKKKKRIIKKYTGEQLLESLDKRLTKDLKKFSMTNVHALNEKGERITEVDDWKRVDEGFKGKHGIQLNKWLHWNAKGKFNMDRFMEKFVYPTYKGDKLPEIPLEVLMRVQYELKLNQLVDRKKLRGDKAMAYRNKYRRSTLKNDLGETLDTKFKPIGIQDEKTYVPHTWGDRLTKAQRKELSGWLTEQTNDMLKRARKDPDSFRDILIESKRKEYDKTGDMNIIETAVRQVMEARYEQFYDGVMSNTMNAEKHVADSLFIDMSSPDALSRLTHSGFFSRPENILARESEMPGYLRDPQVLDRYMRTVLMAQYKNLAGILANYEIENFRVSKRIGKHTDDWADFYSLYVWDSFGRPTTFNEKILRKMNGEDPLKFKWNPYYATSDRRVIDTMERLKKMFNGKLPFKVPEGEEARASFFVRKAHQFGRLEAKYELMTLLAHSGVAVGNIFGGSKNTITKTGFRNFRRAMSFSWIKKNLLFDPNDKPLLFFADGKPVKTKKDLNRWVIQQGVVEHFIQNELDYNPRLRASKNFNQVKEFSKEMIKILKRNPEASNETLTELAKRYGVLDLVTKVAAFPMQASERFLRQNAFLAHMIHNYEMLGGPSSGIDFGSKAMVELGLQGVENTQFIYHSVGRAPSMRPALGKVASRFKLFVQNQLAFKRERWNHVKIYGFKPGTEPYERFQRMFVFDIMSVALATMYAYSLFDTALDPPWDWLKETSEWLYGTKRERKRAFFGQYHRAVAPLQIVTPPVARIPISVWNSLINNDWARFADYHAWTMVPFGRFARSVDKTFDEPYGTTFGRGMQQFFRLPVDKVTARYNRAQINKERKRMIDNTLTS